MTVTTSVHPAYPRLQASIDEIIPEQLYIGKCVESMVSILCLLTLSRSLSAALSPAVLSKHGITHTISVCPEHPSTGDHHLSIAVDDSEYADLLIRLPSACEFIDSALAQGGRVLVHCVMGISRSATVVAAYRTFSISLFHLRSHDMPITQRRKRRVLRPVENCIVVRCKCCYSLRPRCERVAQRG